LAASGCCFSTSLAARESKLLFTWISHEFPAVAGVVRFAKIHLAGRRIGENVQTDTGGEDGDCERMTEQVFS